jgi:hypothetical protein
MAPNLRSTVTPLVFSPNLNARGILDVSYALVGLGAHFRGLEISIWPFGMISSPLHLPSEMPQLTNIILRWVRGYEACEKADQVIQSRKLRRLTTLISSNINASLTALILPVQLLSPIVESSPFRAQPSAGLSVRWHASKCPPCSMIVSKSLKVQLGR